MDNITQAQVKAAIGNFLNAQFDKKAMPLFKNLQKALQDNDVDVIEKIRADIKKAEEKYVLNTWMEYASSWMSEQLSFGTHISKGVHASSRGDNLIYVPPYTSDHTLFAGHHSLTNPIIDASGNAAALPFAAFVQTIVLDNITIGDLIKTQNSSLKGTFHSDDDKSEHINKVFYKLVIAHIDNPLIDEYNKQILFPIVDSYVCLTPLYPTSLTHYIFTYIQDIKFSDENTLAKKNRPKITEEQKPYVTIHDLAVLNIGGSNPQGVSQLMSKKRGKTYLLPSLPPSFTQSETLVFSKNASSIFNAKAMAYKTRRTLDALYNISKANYNNMSIRDARKSILDDLLLQILKIANGIQINRPAGWSIDYKQLDYAEKLWLDPHRRDLVNEETFNADFEKGVWQQEIEKKFASWLQELLKKEFPKIKNDFSDAEQNEWEKEMADALKESKRLGQGAFQ